MKFSQYNYFLHCNDGIAIINTFNAKYVKITKEEDIKHVMQLCCDELPLIIEDNIVESLYKQGYIVDSELDEYKLVKDEVNEVMKKYEKNLEIVLYTTDQCNFRCIYCPEVYTNTFFSDENWNALYKHIEKGIKNEQYESISISFFGGEPLLAVDKIILFLEKLQEFAIDYPNVYFNHQITTNGYLLTPEIYDKLVSLNLIQYQITVDGFAETHNKMRPLAGGQGNWDKIIENLKYINSRNDRAHILLRANYNASNVKTLKEYQKWQKETFKNPKFTFEYYPVSYFSKLVPKELLDDRFSEDSLEVQEKLKNGMQYLKKFGSMCNLARPSRYTIRTKGEIAKCENLSGEKSEYEQVIIGHLGENGDFVLQEGSEVWFKDFETENCKNCVIYPICCARSCPAKKVLYPDTRPDCSTMVDYFEKRLVHLFENNV